MTPRTRSLLLLVSAVLLVFDLGYVGSVVAQQRRAARSPRALRQPRPVKPEVQGPPPRFVVDRREHDFGHIPQGLQVTHAFKISNQGEGPLKLLSVSSSCGCTVAEIEKRELAPLESAEVKVSFDSAGRFGQFHKTVTLSTNDSESPHQLLITGTIDADIIFGPSSMVFNGPGSQEFVVWSPAKKPFQVTRVEAPAGVEVGEPQPAESGFRYQVSWDGSEAGNKEIKFYTDNKGTPWIGLLLYLQKK